MLSWRGILLVFWTTFLIGCQSYQREPLDLDTHDQSVAARDPAAGAVAAYAQHLQSMGHHPRLKYDPSDGLSLPEAEVVALFYNPQLRTARLKARVPLAGAREAGRWEDPELSVDAERILSGVDKPWVLGAMLSFTLPLSGRTNAEKQRAIAEADAELLRAYGQELQLLVELRSKWLEWSAAAQKVELTRQYLHDLEEAVQKAEKLRTAGELDKLDARLFRIERAIRAGELRILQLEQREQETALKALMGLAPQAQVHLVPTLSIARPATQPAGVSPDHPRLLLARAEHEVAERALALEIRKQYPDLKLGAGPGTEQGDRRLLAGLSLPLPILNANSRAIAEARAARQVARATAEATSEELGHELARARIVLETAEARRAYLQNEVAPLVDEQLADARKLAKLGDASTLLSLEAYTRAYETKLQVLEATQKQTAALNQLGALLRPGLTPPKTETKP